MQARAARRGRARRAPRVALAHHVGDREDDPADDQDQDEALSVDRSASTSAAAVAAVAARRAAATAARARRRRGGAAAARPTAEAAAAEAAAGRLRPRRRRAADDDQRDDPGSNGPAHARIIAHPGRAMFRACRASDDDISSRSLSSPRRPARAQARRRPPPRRRRRPRRAPRPASRPLLRPPRSPRWWPRSRPSASSMTSSRWPASAPATRCRTPSRPRAASARRGAGSRRRWTARPPRRNGRANEAMAVSFDSHRVEPDGKRVTRAIDVVNVVAVLPGTSPQAAARRYYVIGHYDSRRTDPLDEKGDSPGANDDASGTAVVIELARVLAKRRLDSTVVFMATAGEEQGLLGAKAHAAAARAAGADIRGVLNNDIVGDPTAPSGAVHRGRVRLFSEAAAGGPATGGAGRAAQAGGRERLAVAPAGPLRRRGGGLARPRRPAAARLPLRPLPARRRSPRVQRDRLSGGALHRRRGALRPPAPGRAQRGRPSTTATCRPSWTAPYLAGVARVNARRAHAPGQRAVVAGRRAHGHRRARPTTPPSAGRPAPSRTWPATRCCGARPPAAVWQHARDVGEVTEARLPMSKDNWFFAVRSYDREGYRSPASFPVAADK